MALAKLDNSKNPKIVVVTNSSLNYINKDNELKQREPKTAALNIVHEAANVAKMDLGSVQASFKIGQGENAQWQNYWVNIDEKNNITLKPCNSTDPKDIVYANAFHNEYGGYSHSFNTNNEAGKAFVEGLNVKTYVNEQEARTAHYVESRVTLKNDELKTQLTQKGGGAIAVLSKNGFEVKLESELRVEKTQSQEQSQKTIETAKEKQNTDMDR